MRFRIDYRVEKISRSFGTVWLGTEEDVPGPGSSVNLQVASNGWARVAGPEQFSRSGGVGVESDEYEALASVGAAAEAAGLGMYTTAAGAAEASLRRIVWSVPQAEGAAVAARVAGIPLTALVEQVRSLSRLISGVWSPPHSCFPHPASLSLQVPNGSLVRVLVLPGQSPRGPLESADAAGAFVVLSVGIAGVQCLRVPGPATAAPPAAAAPAAAEAPRGPGGSWASKAPGGPTARPGAAAVAGAGASAPRPELSPGDAAIAAEAKAFTEALLLNRLVTVLIGGVDKYGNLFGRVELVSADAAPPSPDIAVELLRGGFGKIADFSLSFTAPATHGGALRLAERAAKAAKARVWRDHVAAPTVLVGDREYMGAAARLLPA